MKNMPSKKHDIVRKKENGGIAKVDITPIEKIEKYNK